MRSVNIGLTTLSAVALLMAQAPGDLSRQIADVMSQYPSGKAHQRFVHAKGIVCQGVFEAAPDAHLVSRAPHLRGSAVVTVRFSDGAPDSHVSDTSPDASPRGMAIRFHVGRGTDIMAISHNGFIVGTGEDFLALQRALAATDATKPHPWPIESFLEGHPTARKFAQDPKPIPQSFVTESYYGNNAFLFVNSNGKTQAGRYQIIPFDGARYLGEAAAKVQLPDFLREELGTRLAAGPAQFRLLVQLANPEDQTSDSSIPWPDSRPTVELGIVTITGVVANSAGAEADIAFDPTRLIDGIKLSDDPLPALRSRVYAYSVAGRQQSK